MLQVFRKQFVSEISHAGYLAVITDISGQTQLVIVFRYISKVSRQVLSNFCDVISFINLFLIFFRHISLTSRIS